MDGSSLEVFQEQLDIAQNDSREVACSIERMSTPYIRRTAPPAANAAIGTTIRLTVDPF